MSFCLNFSVAPSTFEVEWSFSATDEHIYYFLCNQQIIVVHMVRPFHKCINFMHNRPHELKQFLWVDLKLEFMEEYPRQYSVGNESSHCANTIGFTFSLVTITFLTIWQSYNSTAIYNATLLSVYTLEFTISTWVNKELPLYVQLKGNCGMFVLNVITTHFRSIIA